MSSATLAQIVTDNPAAARILERHHLDYCCGGQRTLERACADAGTDVDVVRHDLATEVTPGPMLDRPPLTPSELVDHLEVTHHRYLRGELPRLSALANKVLDVHGTRHPELREVATLVDELRADLEPHLAKEEQVLFPMIRALATEAAVPAFHCGSVANPISRMLAEHDHTGELLVELHTATGGYRAPADACASFRALYAGLAELEADTHLHVHKENNLLFPAVLHLEQERRTADRDH